MLPPIYVTGEWVAVSNFQDKTIKPKHICSIVDKDADLIAWPGTDNVLCLNFDDIEKSYHYGYVGIDNLQASQILIWCDKVVANPGPVLIHCAQGVSRSTAVALILLYKLTNNRTKAIELLDEVIKQTCEAGYRDSFFYRPNRRIVNLCELNMGCINDTSLLQLLNESKPSNLGPYVP